MERKHSTPSRKTAPKPSPSVSGMVDAVFQTMVRQAGDGLFLHYGKRFVYVNPAFERLIGYTSAALLNMGLQDIIRPDLLDGLRVLYDQIKSGQPLEKRYETVILTRSGQEIVLSIAPSVITLGRKKTILAVARDITGRARTQQDLESSREFLASLIDNSSEAIIATDFHGKVLIFNKAAETVSGYKAKDLINQTVSFEQFMGKGEQKRILALLNQGTAERPISIVGEETTLYAQDGSLIPISLSVAFIYRDGLPAGTISIFRDLRPIKDVQDRLRVSEQKYRMLVEKANDGFFVYQDHVFKYTNPKFQEFLGYPKEEISTMGLKDIVRPELAEIIEDRFERRIRGEKVPDHYEITFVGKDGVWRDFEITPAVIEFEGRAATQNIIRDVTQRKRMERELAQARKMAILGEMSAHIAHEVRNPLQKMKTGLELFSRSTTLDERQEKILEGVHGGIENLERFVTEILEWSRSGEVRLKEYHISNIINGLVFNREAEFNTRAIQLETYYDQAVDRVMADGIHLRQALEDILDNALDAMPSGGVIRITTQALPGHTFVHAGRSASVDALEIRIQDTGHGIAPEDLGRVFEPFFTRKSTGTGLGLALVQKVVEMHKGQVEVLSVPGQGAEFVIRLPLDPTTIP
ncbi:MAG: PAS domain S-box protein [Syntrophaceae bacterium]